MKVLKIFVVAILFLASCENAQFRNREKGALVGGGLGAGLGAIIGNQFGSAGAGVAIGSAFGALSGAVVGQDFDNQEDDQLATEDRLNLNERELAENRRMLDQLKRRGIDARVTKRGVVANLPDVLFDFGKASITASARQAVKEIAEVAKTSNERIISVEGHTDSVGGVSFNQQLSEDRANAVADALEREGVTPGNLRTKGFGKLHPIASNDTDYGRQQNRRVEVIIENRR